MINNNFRVLQLGKFYPICGGVDNMFYDDPRMSRAVITKTK